MECEDHEEMRKRSEIRPLTSLLLLWSKIEPKYEHDYKSEYRGKSAEPCRLRLPICRCIQLVYFPNTKSLSGVQAYDKDVEAFSMTLDKNAKDKVYIVCTKDQLHTRPSSMETAFLIIDKPLG